MLLRARPRLPAGGKERKKRKTYRRRPGPWHFHGSANEKQLVLTQRSAPSAADGKLKLSAPRGDTFLLCVASGEREKRKKAGIFLLTCASLFPERDGICRGNAFSQPQTRVTFLLPSPASPWAGITSCPESRRRQSRVL